MPTIAEKAYAAGVIDGEGCVSVYRRGPGKTGNRYVTPTIHVSNTNFELLEWLHKRWGGTVYRCKIDPRGNRKPVGSWQIAGRKAIACLDDVLPYLLVKREQAHLLLALKRCKSIDRDSMGRLKGTLTEEDVAVRDELVTNIRKLNRRGVVRAIN